MSEQVKKGWLHTREGDKFVPITLVENVYSRSGTPYDNIVKQYLAEWKSDNDTDITDIRAELNSQATDISNLENTVNANHTEILERLKNFQDTDDGTLWISDTNGNIIAYINADGLHVLDVEIKSGMTMSQLESDVAKLQTDAIDLDGRLDAIDNIFGAYDETSQVLYIVDKNDNVIAYFDASGLNVIDVTIGDKNSDKYALYKVITDLLADDTEIHKQLDNHENRVNVLESWKPEEIAAREEVAANLSKVANFYVSQEKAPRNNGDLALDNNKNLTIWNGLTGQWEDFIGLSRQLKEKTQYFDGSSSDSFYIVDKNDKVVAYFDKEGFHAIRIYVGGLDDNEQYEVYQDLTTLYTNLDAEKQRSERIDTDHEGRLRVIEKQIHALGNIMQFAGAVNIVPTDTSGYQDGDVIVEISSGKEYVLSNGIWVELGDTSAELEAIQRLQAIVGDPGVIEKTHEARLDLLETNLADESDAREQADKAINDTLDSLQTNMNWTNSDGKLFIIDDNNNVIAYFDEEGLTTYNTTIQTLKNGNIEYKKNLQVNGIYFSDKQSVQINWLD